MLSEMHFAWLVHRAHSGSRSVARPQGQGEAGADAVSAYDVMHWGSAGGARVLGFDGVGTLAVGQAADLAVWCAGRIVAEGDAIPDFDLGRLRAEARDAVRRLALR